MELTPTGTHMYTDFRTAAGHLHIDGVAAVEDLVAGKSTRDVLYFEYEPSPQGIFTFGIDDVETFCTRRYARAGSPLRPDLYCILASCIEA